MQYMPEKVKPYEAEEGGKKEQVTQMFDNIAGGYDFLNRLLSARFDVRWRNILTEKILSNQPVDVLDVATGTADVAVTLAKKSKDVKIKVVESANNVLAIGKKIIDEQKLQHHVPLACADAEKMDEENDAYDVVTSSFVGKNFENLVLGLQEMSRITREGRFVYSL